jgi:hypothetical protein
MGRPPHCTPSPGALEHELRDELALVALPSAVNLVRLFVRRIFADSPVAPGYGRRVEKVAEELAVHTVNATDVHSAMPRSRAFDDLRIVAVRLRVLAGQIVVEMWDRTPEPPAGWLAEALHDAGADNWGYHHPQARLRVVWCGVARPALPGRDPRQPAPPVRPSATSPPTAGLHRVRDGRVCPGFG